MSKSLRRSSRSLVELITSSSHAGPSHVPSLSFCLGPRRPVSSSSTLNSGHNRWSKIRHKKGAADAQRSALFSRLTNDIHQALRPPNSLDPEINSRLAVALEKARQGGVPKANVESAFQRARSTADGTGQNVVYEAVGAGGKVGIMVECLTDNPSRCVQRVKEILHKHGARIAPVSFMFERKGLITLLPESTKGQDFEDLFEKAVEGGAEDVREAEDEDGNKLWEVSTPSNLLSSLTTTLSATPSGYTVESSELVYVPLDPLAVLSSDAEDQVEADVEGLSEDKAEVIMKAVECLEELQDVVRVWTNIAEE